MEDNRHKEEWINTIMNSMHGMVRSTQPAGLSEKIFSGLNNPVKARIVAIPIKQWAAAAILLLALNIGSVLYFANRDTRTNGNTNGGAIAEMTMESTYNY